MIKNYSEINQDIMADSIEGSIIFIGITCVTIIIIQDYFYKIIGNEYKYKLIVYISVFCSYPFLSSAIKTGNPILIVVMFLMISLYYINDKTKLSKEITLLNFAIAIAFKIIPCIFAISYLKNKKYEEFIKLIIYSAVLFFSPFIFYDGYSGFKLFLNNLLIDQKELICYGTLPFIIKDMPISGLLKAIIPFIFLIFLLIFAYGSKKNFVTYLLLCEAMLLIPGVTQPYSIVYMIIPLAFWIRFNGKRKLDYTYACLYPFVFWSWSYFYSYLALWTMCLIGTIEIVIDYQDLKMNNTR